MAEEHTDPEEQETDEGDSGKEQVSSKGSSRFSRTGIDSSISDWINSKEKGPTKRASKVQRGRGRLNPGKGLNPVSRKQKKKNADYKKAREEHYSKIENRRCALCGTTDNLSVHHTNKRGNNIADASTFVTLCILGSAIDAIFPELNSCQGLGCHGKVERNKGWARDNNLLI